MKGQAPGKLTGCERDLAINLPGCPHLLFLLSFTRKTKNAQLKIPTDVLHKNLMKPLGMMQVFYRLSGPGLSPSQGHCVVFLGKTVYSHRASLPPGVLKWLPVNLRLGVAL